MPRQFFRKYLPHADDIKNNRYLSFLGDKLHTSEVWHLTRHSLAGGVSVGLFCAFIPFPFQMVIAAIAAMLLRVNLPIAVAMVWITNPLTIPFIFYGAYEVGAWVLGVPSVAQNFDITIDWVRYELIKIWKPLLLGCLICGVSSAVAGNLVLRWFWRFHVARNWQRRKLRLIQKLKNVTKR